MRRESIAPTIKYKNQEAYVPNLDDYNNHFWRNNYLIRLTIQGIPFIVNADHEQDALDYVIDFCEEYLPGLIMSQKDQDEEKYIDEYICGGNHCLYLNVGYHEMTINRI
jgi:hypothetical protein